MNEEETLHLTLSQEDKKKITPIIERQKQRLVMMKLVLSDAYMQQPTPMPDEAYEEEPSPYNNQTIKPTMNYNNIDFNKFLNNRREEKENLENQRSKDLYSF